ncbi:anaerobic ribonucleoside-triphosphate reductase activating protein [Clostridia bacterium]|nr:anaerobic ribonucleoside-triphosphate reductase activating protein [Clostridia bacterium]
MCKLRLAGVIKESIVDGPGIRLTVFTQGCPHKCEGCHNPQTHDSAGGYDSSVENIVNEVKKNPLLHGVTLSGGEPFMQAESLAKLAKELHLLGLNIITYSGYTFEEILSVAQKHPSWSELLNETDILIDGKFELEQKSLLLHFRGSKNQRVIDVKQSIAMGKIVEVEI